MESIVEKRASFLSKKGNCLKWVRASTYFWQPLRRCCGLLVGSSGLNAMVGADVFPLGATTTLPRLPPAIFLFSSFFFPHLLAPLLNCFRIGFFATDPIPPKIFLCGFPPGGNCNMDAQERRCQPTVSLPLATFTVGNERWCEW